MDSWDRFIIPKPAARVRVLYGRPFEVAPGDAGFSQGMTEARQRLDEIAGPAS
jgi:lysophospholipid acyltransferase (LPLAT)-like uncharacterized protein